MRRRAEKTQLQSGRSWAPTDMRASKSEKSGITDEQLGNMRSWKLAASVFKAEQGSSEISVTKCQTTQGHIMGDLNLNTEHHQKPKYHIYTTTLCLLDRASSL